MAEETPARHPPAARMAAVTVMAPVLAGTMQTKEAVELFNKLYNGTTQHPVQKVDQFLKRWAEHYQKHGHVEDAPRSGRPSTLAEDEATQLAKFLKAGTHFMPMPTEVEPDPRAVHRFFTSVQDAVDHCPTLSEACNKHNIRPRQLLRRLLAVDGNLVRRMTDYKLPFTPAQMAARMEAASQLLRMPMADLQRVVWIDCATFWVDPTNLNQVVWCDRSDARVEAVVTAHGEPSHKKYKLKFIVAVSGSHGPVYMEFVSGTTDMQRAKGFSDITGHEGPYHVSHTLFRCLCAPRHSAARQHMPHRTWALRAPPAALASRSS